MIKPFFPFIASALDENNEPKRITSNDKMMIIAMKSTDRHKNRNKGNAKETYSE